MRCAMRLELSSFLAFLSFPRETQDLTSFLPVLSLKTGRKLENWIRKVFELSDVMVAIFAQYAVRVRPGFNLKRVVKRVKKRKRNVACDLLHKKEAVRDDHDA